jgi:membrane protease YdiL (CAAX protease family)
VALGGSVHLDLGGVVLLLLLGGVLGLIVHWIYQKGRRDAEGDDK